MGRGEPTPFKLNTNLSVFFVFTLAVAINSFFYMREAAGEATGLLAVDGPKEEMGAWYAPPLPPQTDRMQAVHATLLPNGKVLIVNGSSNRNTMDENGIIQNGVDVWDYAVVNNTVIFDPDASLGSHGFTRLESPPTRVGDANDLFCSGQMHLPNGNVLFVSGTRAYYPLENFRGSKKASVFAWRTLTWNLAGETNDGHWYPTLVPLADGQVATISGVSYDKASISRLVEFYDPSQPADKAWTSIDIENLPHSPFNTAIGEGSELDGLALYPRIVPLPDGRLFLTNDGTGGGNMQSQNSYFMSIIPQANGLPPRVSFSPGPKRKATTKTYSTVVVDPNAPDSDILLIGGQKGNDDINYGPNNPVDEARVTADLERFTPPTDTNDIGAWEFTPDFLGDRPEDVRMMANVVILPTKQLLVVGGGNYAFHRPVFHALLLTRDASAPGGYGRKRMNPAEQPRLYHSVALLLPDGRVLTAGGNANRAARSLDGSVNLAIHRDPRYPNKDWNRWSSLKGRSGVVPAEIWQVEIFYPPYLFLPGKRPEITQAPETVDYGASATIKVDNMTPEASLVLIKLGSVTHGWDSGQRLVGLQFSQDVGKSNVTFTAPTNRHTSPPGYYMLFYINAVGKPSHAAMVRLGKLGS